MRGQETHTKTSASHSVIVIAVCWAVLFVAVLLLFYLSGRPPTVEAAKDMIELGPSFSLNHVPATSFDVLGETPVRIEDEGVAFLDALGKEQSFVAFPYYQSRHFLAGGALMVTPDEGGGLTLITAEQRDIETGIQEIVLGADYRDGVILIFGDSAKGKMMAGLYDVKAGSYRFVIDIDALLWPLKASFVPGADTFDLLLLDLSKGKSQTKIQRYDLEGHRLFEHVFEEDEAFPHLVPFSSGELCLLNDRSLLMFDLETKTVSRETLPGTPMRWEEFNNKLHILMSKAGEPSLVLWPHDIGPLDDFALMPSEVYCLAAEGEELMLIDADTMTVLSRTPTGKMIRRILPLDSHHFWVFFDEEATLASIR